MGIQDEPQNNFWRQLFQSTPVKIQSANETTPWDQVRVENRTPLVIQLVYWIISTVPELVTKTRDQRASERKGSAKRKHKSKKQDMFWLWISEHFKAPWL